jgi:hypothetical protein
VRPNENPGRFWSDFEMGQCRVEGLVVLVGKRKGSEDWYPAHPDFEKALLALVAATLTKPKTEGATP